MGQSVQAERGRMKGYVILPIFTVELRDGEFEMTCSDFLARVFEIFFAPFWNGKVHVENVWKGK